MVHMFSLPLPYACCFFCYNTVLGNVLGNRNFCTVECCKRKCCKVLLHIRKMANRRDSAKKVFVDCLCCCSASTGSACHCALSCSLCCQPWQWHGAHSSWYTFLLHRQAVVWQALKYLTRPALHAQTLGFDHPVSGKRLQFTSELPTDFQETLSRLDSLQ